MGFYFHLSYCPCSVIVIVCFVCSIILVVCSIIFVCLYICIFASLSGLLNYIKKII